MAGRLIAATLVLSAGLFQTSCWEEQHPGSYYTFSGETVADFLSNRDSVFSDFIYCLKKANVWGEMQAYGNHTCFAPTNEAIKTYIMDKYGATSITELSDDECDTIARTHLCASTFYCKDLNDGAFPSPNLLDRFLTYSTDSALDETGKYKVVYKVNKVAPIIERDDSAVNGVVHIMGRVVSPSNDFLPDLMEKDSSITVFCWALGATHLKDSLVGYIDPSYPEPAYDSTLLCFQTTGKTGFTYETAYEKGDNSEKAVWPTKRYFRYTAFVPRDNILKDSVYLRDLAFSIYGDDGAEDDPTDRRNSLNKFISYHLLPIDLSYDQLTMSHEQILNNFVKRDNLDIEDFYETMLPHSIIRISNPNNDTFKYINRKGTKADKNLTHPGVKVLKTDSIDATALNGEYHYLDGYLKYDTDTRENALNTRMRYMCNTMSPDFINSNARGRLSAGGDKTDRYVMGFKQGFIKNWKFSEESQFFVRYADPTFTCYRGEEITFRGKYDIAIKLPPVPYDGTYEIRIFCNTMASDTQVGSDRGIVQYYFKQGDYTEDKNWEPCGIPRDLRIKGDDPRIGNVKDDDLDGETEIAIHDKVMHNHGYLKGPDCYQDAQGQNLRQMVDCVRIIASTEYMFANTDYAIRLRLVKIDSDAAVCPFNFIEIVPKAVYAGETLEDRH